MLADTESRPIYKPVPRIPYHFSVTVAALCIGERGAVDGTFTLCQWCNQDFFQDQDQDFLAKTKVRQDFLFRDQDQVQDFLSNLGISC